MAGSEVLGARRSKRDSEKSSISAGSVEPVVRQLRVVTHRTWIADAFADDPEVLSDPRVSGVRQDFGFDIDQLTADTSWWWAPGAWAAGVRAAGISVPLLSCGPEWLLGLPDEYVRRKVVVCCVDETYETIRMRMRGDLRQTERVFVKLPESKIDVFPAGLFAVAPNLNETLVERGLPRSAVVQLSEEVKFGTEARFFVAQREIAAGSLYKIGYGGLVWSADEFAAMAATVEVKDEFDRLKAFADRVVADRRVDQPPGWVLDVGMLNDGPAVVEANAAWSSVPYDCRPSGVLESIIASHDVSDEHAQWRWNPEDVLARSANAVRVVRETKS